VEVQLRDLGVMREIGQGAQARVHALESFSIPGIASPLAYKEYVHRNGGRHLIGLQSIVDRRARLDAHDRQTLDDFAAWPIATVIDKGVITGILMPLISTPFTFALKLHGGATEQQLCTLQYAFIDPDRASTLGAPTFGTPARIHLEAKFATAFAFLHERGIVFGDISANNALFHIDGDDCRVMLVDCDAVRIAGNAPVVTQLNSPDWDPPPTQGQLAVDQTKRTDVYKFGLLVLRLLSAGHGASTLRTPPDQLDGLNPAGMDLLCRSLDSNQEGPEMKEWVDVLTALPYHVGQTEPNGSGRTVGSWTAAPEGGWIKIGPADAKPMTPQAHDHPGWERDGDDVWVRRGE